MTNCYLDMIINVFPAIRQRGLLTGYDGCENKREEGSLTRTQHTVLLTHLCVSPVFLTITSDITP